VTGRKRLLRVTAPHFVAGAVWELTPHGWRCARTAPLLNWMRRVKPAEAREALVRAGYEWAWLESVDGL
jgi:hypothetical protein